MTGNDKDELEKWADETDMEPLYKTDVTDLDKFVLARLVMLVAAVIYVLVATVAVSIDQNLMKDVWDYSKVALNSIVTVLIGYYFGRK